MYLVKRLFQEIVEIIATFRKKGLKVGILHFCEIIQRIVYSKAEYFLMAHDLDLSHIDHDFEAANNLVIKQIKSREEINCLFDLKDLSDFIPDPINWMKKVFDDGGIGFIAFHNNQPAGCDWISFKIASDLMRVPVPLKPGDAYLHALFVTRDKRRIGCGHMLGMHLLSFLKENGYERGVITVLKNNAPSLRVHKILGYKCVHEVLHTRFLLWDFYKYM